MRRPEQIAPLRRRMQRLALVVSVLTAVSLPLAYFTVSYDGQAKLLSYQAELTARRLVLDASLHGSVWLDSKGRLSKVMAGTQAAGGTLHERLTAADGRELARYAPLPEWPLHSERAEIVVSGKPIATLTVSTTMKPLVLQTVAVGLFAVVLALGAFVALFMLPLRALEETLDELQRSLATTEAHAAETTFAFEELKRQHRLVEETTQELMRARDQALAADRTKSAFLATMSHELRTPLNAIIGFSEMLSQEIFGPLGSQRYRDYSQSICESGRHLLAVINDVLDISKVQAGKLQLHLEDVELGALLESCRRLVGTKVVEAGVELDIAPPSPPLPALRADAVRLKQIVFNLLSNALKFTPAGGRITISFGGLPDAGAYFTITDTGIGMSAPEIAIALEPFRQVDNSHTRKYEGTGLGLPLAKALAEQHGGRLEVESRPGAGTAVTVTLPPGEAASGALPSAARGASRGQTAL